MERHRFPALLACLFAFPALALPQASLLSSIGGPAGVASSGNLSLISQFGPAGIEPSEAGSTALIHGLAPQVLFSASDSAITTASVSIAATGTAPVLRWQSSTEASGVGYRVFRAVEFAGGWIVDSELSASPIPGTGAGVEYAFADTAPYTFGDAERIYLIEIAEPTGGRTLAGPLTFFRSADQANDTWTIF